MMKAGDIPEIPRGVRLHFDHVRKSWVLLAPERAVMLDDIGHAILSRVDGEISFGEIVNDLAETYGAPVQQIEQDTNGFLSALAERLYLDIRA